MKITFRPVTEQAGLLFPPPIPASKAIPQWYRDMPQLLEGYTKGGLLDESNLAPNKTVKSCTPFLDALSAGYIYTLAADLEVRRDDDNLHFKWRVEGEFVDSHAERQAPGMPRAVGNEKGPLMKWNGYWAAHTPPGYSMLFTHPANRHDLPFRTFTGVVDTDEYPEAVSFPFEWIKDIDERVVLERGTPLAQMIPFRRDDWESTTVVYDDIEQRKAQFSFASRIIRAYKSQFWHKKVWS